MKTYVQKIKGTDAIVEYFYDRSVWAWTAYAMLGIKEITETRYCSDREGLPGLISEVESLAREALTSEDSFTVKEG